MIRIAFDELLAGLNEAVLRLGFRDEAAALCARLFAETTRDGVYTHGLARFPRFAAMVRAGTVVVEAVPTQVTAFGALERWDGNLGAGNVNAFRCMGRAMELAEQYGTGTVALRNTNHWMRGGTYGWQAADAGMFAICMTNSLANVPAWGAVTPSIGNNPLVLAVPRRGGANVVIDIAMSQYSYGALSGYAQRGEELPYAGGFDAEGKLTRDPKAIAATERALPIGLWKGSGLSVAMDLMAAMMSAGMASHQIERDPLKESGVSQVFLAMDARRLGEEGSMDGLADAVIASLHCAEPVDAGRPVRYPGEHTLVTREENMRLGVPVDEEIWEKVVRVKF